MSYLIRGSFEGTVIVTDSNGVTSELSGLSAQELFWGFEPVVGNADGRASVSGGPAIATAGTADGGTDVFGISTFASGSGLATGTSDLNGVSMFTPAFGNADGFADVTGAPQIGGGGAAAMIPGI